MMSYLFSINVNHWCQPGMQVTFLFEIKKKMITSAKSQAQSNNLTIVELVTINQILIDK